MRLQIGPRMHTMFSRSQEDSNAIATYNEVVPGRTWLHLSVATPAKVLACLVLLLGGCMSTSIECAAYERCALVLENDGNATYGRIVEGQHLVLLYHRIHESSGLLGSRTDSGEAERLYCEISSDPPLNQVMKIGNGHYNACYVASRGMFDVQGADIAVIGWVSVVKKTESHLEVRLELQVTDKKGDVIRKFDGQFRFARRSL